MSGASDAPISVLAQSLPQPAALPGLADIPELSSSASTVDSRSLLALANPQTHLPLANPGPLPGHSPLSLPPSADFLLPHSDTPGMKTPKSSTPRPATGDSPAGVQKSPEVRALNVTDALSYLDAVKVQFQDKPEVYNRFLDIMKDFKSQVIDTPGVIQRVSRLFHGNPYLIQGFNTFLPMGYRIDISADPLDPNTITVTTPLGTTTQSTNIPRSHATTPTFSGAPSVLPTLAGPSVSRAHTPHIYGQPAQYDAPFSPGIQNPQTTAAASVLGNMGNNNRGIVDVQQPAGEFNHAIYYLNKIKARYADDANTYKQFLDILQTYQREQRHLQDSQVYVQVQHLFKDAPDLLAEFKDFLPDAGPAVSGQPGPAILPQPLASSSPATWSQPEAASPVDKGTKKVAAPSKRKRRVVEKEVTPVPPAKPAPSRAKKVKHHHKSESTPASFSPLVQPKSPQPPPIHITSAAPVVQPVSMPHSHALQPQASLHGVGSLGGTSADKLLFFDRAKKSLESREMYEDFLKLLSLFSKEIIDAKMLIDRAQVFLGDADLLAEFKDLIGWDERQDNTENGPPGSIRTGPPEALSALPADDGQGPSYRKLPDSEVRLACSGRDELCRSVLNDGWVSHPTWASEDSGFVAHKKNQFEEALHKSEEERYEYQVHLEGLGRTIAVLEPINNRIEEMTNEERTLFKLKPDFGGPSRTIYHRLIRKVYGRDSGLEVIQALQDCPSVAVPVVLARLRQKDEEWRRAQREWSRTWREVDSKNFYKSLDHQGISFKQNDKKNITAKHFVQDIEAIKNRQLEAWEEEEIPSYVRGSVGHQLEYAFHDTSVLLDSLKMVYSFLDRSQAQYNSQERRAVEKFLRVFIPLLCMYPVAEFNAACGPLEGAHDDDPLIELNGFAEGHTKSGRRSTGSTHSVHSSGVAANDLRRKLLRTAQERATGKSTPAASRDSSPSPGHRSPNIPRAGEISECPEDIWITEAGANSFAQNLAPGVDSERPFFANTTFYTLLRLLQLLYSRLLMCKEIGARHAAEKHANLLANRVAVELGLDEPNGPSVVLEQTMEVLGDRGASDNANVVYMYLLNACEKFFDSEMDLATFEEHMRWFFGTKAYLLFTLDKVITALVKQVQTILSDNRCQELWRLLQSAQNSEVITNQDVVRYRREAERHVGQDDHLYRLQWVRELKCIRVHLVGPDEPSMDGDRTAVGRWRGYVDSYVMNYPTEWTSTKKGGAPVFLRRCVRTEDGAALCDNHLRIRVRPGSYKMLYESGSEDMVWRRREGQVLLGRAQGRSEERRRVLCDMFNV
ncbi:Paired amphipathic helix protein pst1 [Hypsizygus marmoreus]|uniref:Paired amphipathic helix protein pst1 n=1 Tax=Hypsizygus marmoreus TaxID=39966 RepID=A0A369K6U6_HYPMA|nr:Paired amphipathic helix protein pst1 [Hypsizygus marmoreus]